MDEADDVRQAALAGIDRHIYDHLKIGSGDNFTDPDYRNSGWFINFVGKL